MRNRSLIQLGALLLAIGLATAAMADQALLSQARQHAHADEHSAAIENYLAAFEADPSLAPQFAHELGNQYTWADLPAQAIRWYETRLASEPTDLDARLGLARALSWTDQTLAAQTQYEAVLESQPDNLDALRGRARMLAWQDRLQESKDACEDILKRYPGDRETRLQHAQVVNWSGDHVDAVELYQEILADHPHDQAALAGLINALRWGGHEREALMTLGPKWANQTSVPLWYELTRATGPQAELSSGLSEDSDELRIYSNSATWEGYALGDLRLSDTRARLGLRHVQMEQDGQPVIRGFGGSVGGAKHLSLRTTLNLHAWALHFGSSSPVVNVSSNDDLSYNLFGYDGWLTYQRSARLRLDFSSDRNYVSTPRSLGYETSVTQLGVSADYRLRSRVFLGALLREGFYSDGNRRLLAQASITRAMGRPWVLRVSPRAMMFRYSESMDRGYWNPERFESLGLNVSVGLERASVRVRPHAEATSAKEWENGAGFGIFAYSGGVSVTLTETFEMDLSGGSSESRLSGSSGYERWWARLVLRIRP